MAIVTHLGTTFDTNSGTHTVVATPSVGAFIIGFIYTTGSLTSTGLSDNNADGSGGTSLYDKPNSAQKNSNTDQLTVFVRQNLVASGTSTTFTFAPGVTTGGGLSVFQVQGMSIGGSGQINHSVQTNQASGTPTISVFATPIILKNPVLSVVFNGTSPGGIVAPTGMVRVSDLGYATPTTGLDLAVADEGIAQASNLTWGSSSASAFCAAFIEVKRNLPIQTSNYQQFDVGNGMSTSEKIR